MAFGSVCVYFLVLFAVVAAAAAEATTEAPCRNTIPDCHYHRREEICHGIYVPWASARCALYCGFCKVPEGYEEDCQDTIPNCVQYQPCNNPSFFVWVEDHCRKYCHHCGPSTTKTTTQKVTHPQTTPKLTTLSTTPATTPVAVTSSGTKPTSSPSAKTTTMMVKTTGQKTQQPVTGPTQTMVSPSGTASQVAPTCSDEVFFCYEYDKSACDNMEWALKYCPRYCNLCDAVQASSTALPKSTSRKPEASTKRETGTTSVHVNTSSSSPKVTTEGPPDSCQDQLGSCNFYSKAACQNEQWGRTYCARFCNLCT